MVRQREEVRLGVGQRELDAAELRHGLVVVDVDVGFRRLDGEAPVGDVALFGGEGFPCVGEVGEDEDEGDAKLYLLSSLTLATRRKGGGEGGSKLIWETGQDIRIS